MSTLRWVVSLASLLFLAVPTAWGQKPPLTLDEFFDAIDIRSVQISPDGHAVVIETMRPDWAGQRFRNDLWLYRDDSGGSLVQLTESGHDSSPQWSPDGHWIAFLVITSWNMGAERARSILHPEFCTPIPTHAFTPLILRKSRMRRRASTDLCGGRSAMVVPTATVTELLTACRPPAGNLVYPLSCAGAGSS